MNTNRMKLYVVWNGFKLLVRLSEWIIINGSHLVHVNMILFLEVKLVKHSPIVGVYLRFPF